MKNDYVSFTLTDQPDVQKALAKICEVIGDNFYPIDTGNGTDQTLGIALVIERSCPCCPEEPDYPVYRISLGGTEVYPQCPLCQPLAWGSSSRDLRPLPAATVIDNSQSHHSSGHGKPQRDDARDRLIASRPLSKRVM